MLVKPGVACTRLIRLPIYTVRRERASDSLLSLARLYPDLSPRHSLSGANKLAGREKKERRGVRQMPDGCHKGAWLGDARGWWEHIKAYPCPDPDAPPLFYVYRGDLLLSSLSLSLSPPSFA